MWRALCCGPIRWPKAGGARCSSCAVRLKLKYRMSPARPRPEEAKLDALNALDAAMARAELNEVIGKALHDKNYRVVGKAASLAEERLLHERLEDLFAAYARFLQDPVKRDPTCLAKKAIVRALVAFECKDIQFYLQGVHYTQPEPVWGGTSDSAVDVRCNCALGLVNSGYVRAVPELAELLSDPEPGARIGAVRAISCGHPREAESLLRFKAHVGDEKPEVMGECFTALLAIAPDECMPLVAAALSNDDDAVRDFAALALGESRHPAALKHLRAAWDDVLVSPEMRAVLIRAAAVHRTDDAFNWLLTIIEAGTPRQAEIAVDALSVYERNTKLTERVHAALASRKSRPRS
jgi:HEAT repeat protein